MPAASAVPPAAVVNVAYSTPLYDTLKLLSQAKVTSLLAQAKSKLMLVIASTEVTTVEDVAVAEVVTLEGAGTAIARDSVALAPGD